MVLLRWKHTNGLEHQAFRARKKLKKKEPLLQIRWRCFKIVSSARSVQFELLRKIVVDLRAWKNIWKGQCTWRQSDSLPASRESSPPWPKKPKLWILSAMNCFLCSPQRTFRSPNSEKIAERTFPVDGHTMECASAPEKIHFGRLRLDHQKYRGAHERTPVRDKHWRDTGLQDALRRRVVNVIVLPLTGKPARPLFYGTEFVKSANRVTLCAISNRVTMSISKDATLQSPGHRSMPNKYCRRKGSPSILLGFPPHYMLRTCCWFAVRWNTRKIWQGRFICRTYEECTPGNESISIGNWLGASRYFLNP